MPTTAASRPVAASTSDVGRLVLVTGGQSSGKTAWAGDAAQAAAGSDAEVVVVAPAEAWDAEMAARIERHRQDRPDHWRTLETFDLNGALEAAGPGTPVVVDALDTWLVRRAYDEGLDDETASRAEAEAAEARILAEVGRFADACRARPGSVWVVAGQPGLGLVPLGVVTRRHVDVHGRACRHLDAAEVVLMIAGAAITAPGPGGRPA